MMFNTNKGNKMTIIKELVECRIQKLELKFGFSSKGIECLLGNGKEIQRAYGEYRLLLEILNGWLN